MLQSLTALRGMRGEARDGAIGRVHDVLFEAGIWAVRYFEMATEADVDEDMRLLLPAGSTDEVDWARGRIKFALSREQAARCPRFLDDKPVSRQEEERLHSFFGWQPYWTGGDLPEGGPEMPVPQGDEMTGDRQAESVPDESLPSGNPNLFASSDVVGYLVEANGGLAGKVVDLIVDDELWMIRYLVVDTSTEGGHGPVLLASQLVDTVSFDTFSVYTDVGFNVLRRGPVYDPSAVIDADQEAALERHFGF